MIKTPMWAPSDESFDKAIFVGSNPTTRDMPQLWFRLSHFTSLHQPPQPRPTSTHRDDATPIHLQVLPAGGKMKPKPRKKHTLIWSRSSRPPDAWKHIYWTLSPSVGDVFAGRSSAIRSELRTHRVCGRERGPCERNEPRSYNYRPHYTVQEQRESLVPASHLGWKVAPAPRAPAR